MRAASESDASLSSASLTRLYSFVKPSCRRSMTSRRSESSKRPSLSRASVDLGRGNVSNTSEGV